jgi:hypothetical protein
MAESIVSPGVFTRENDLSFLPAGIGAIGAAVVGPTVKGPAFVPTVIRQGFAEFERLFGAQSPETYVPFTVKEYLRNAGTVTVVRILAGGGWTLGASRKALFAVDTVNQNITAVFAPSKGSPAGDLSGSTALAGGVGLIEAAALTRNASFGLTFQGPSITTTTVSCSFSPTSADYILKSIGDNIYNSKVGGNTYTGTPAYVDANFRRLGHSSTSSSMRLVTGSVDHVFTSSYSEGYDHAATPWIQSGFTTVGLTIAGGAKTQQLFKFHTLADGTSTNKDYKVSIANLKEPADIDGEEQYSTFSVQVRKFGDTDKRPSILEQFNNCNLDPDSPNFLARVMGDRYAAYSTDFGKVLTYGDYPNISKFIRVEVSNAVAEGAVSPKLSPKGFAAVIDPYRNFSSDAEGSTKTYKFPPTAYRSGSVLSGVYNVKGYLGWDFSETDNSNWNKPLAKNAESNQVGVFNTDSLTMHPSSSATWTGAMSASIDATGVSGPRGVDLKFSVPFQGGSDGLNPATVVNTGEYISPTNLYGYDLSGTNTVGYLGYKKALDILSNQDEYDINMLALPGVLKQYHAAVTDAATQMVEGRGDTFYVMDLTKVDETVTGAVNQADGLDSNYAAVYYPWVKVLDTSRNKPVFVPPSVIIPGTIAASDRIGAEWFAPAGLNRGVLGTVLEAKIRLNQAERDALYEGRVNPIATFPQTGVCVWGQKTLQVRPTALDRINVRRLMIAVKKFIASSSKYLVFEQNTIQTRNRFLNIANPYLESVQQRQGLYAFRVVMDETNNTPDEIDRNRLIGAIYLQPAKTAEFIVLDFNILPTGATFPA